MGCVSVYEQKIINIGVKSKNRNQLKNFKKLAKNFKNIVNYYD